MGKKEIELGLLLKYHDKQIEWVQHERLIHLLITLFTGFLFLTSIIGLLFIPCFFTDLLFLTLLILSIFYIVHYCRLENSVQKWYNISNDIEKNIFLKKGKNINDY